MPYITADRRRAIRAGETPATPGELNYKLTLIAHDYVLKRGMSYNSCNDVLGAFEGAKLEFYRVVATPYEQQKRTLNGPVSPLDGSFAYEDMLAGLHKAAKTEELDDTAPLPHYVKAGVTPGWNNILVYLDDKLMTGVFEADVRTLPCTVSVWTCGPDGPLEYFQGKVQFMWCSADGCCPSFRTRPWLKDGE